MLSQLFLALEIFVLVTAGGPLVSLDYGTFQGAADGNLTKFLGIPFARPTARFDIPRPPLPLRGLQNATAFGPACPQQALESIPGFTSNRTFISEACLTLDVFAPAAAHPHSKLPVLVWIYGGDFEIGGTSDTDVRPTVERSIYLGEPVLIVVPNYRLNAFGFLAGKEVSEEGLTNLGLRDQIFALEWVQKHVAAFGGDPERVVLGGVSAGAISTSLLLLNNKQNSARLFRGAFMVSGAPWPAPTVADGQPFYDELVAVNNCTAAPNTLDCLRRIPFDAFMATVNSTPNFFSYRSLSSVWRPRVDGDVVVRNTFESMAQREFAKIPILSGNVDDEGTLFALSSTNVTTDSEFHDYVQSNYLAAGTPEEVAKIVELYPQNPTLGAPFGTGSANEITPEFKRIAAFEGDFLFVGIRRFLLQHASKTQNTWSWLSKRGKSTPIRGAVHTSDVPLFFPTNSTSATDTVGVDSLINFLNTLDPNVSGAPEPSVYSRSNSTVFWPKWQAPSAEGSPSLLTFSDPSVINVTADNFRAEQIDYLNSLHLSGVTGIGL
ncbi:carotenoid ester lipase precursor [Mycena albidolilacea]|uniref:Carboxylic ester hydrolase n=1 Tax=Mycena albidolilacea TaxID=1033008 RepID=A0AAD7EN71_9AGAR|nr:carotenoid ester lipase precursor [Mycena albidolilacea]